MKLSSFLHKKIVMLFIAVLVVPFLIVPQATYAQGAPVSEVNPFTLTAIYAGSAASQAAANGTDLKSNVLDRLVIVASKVAIQSITKSIVNWINSGFNGSPAFVTDLNQHLLGVGDGIANQFVAQLTVNAKINSPFLSSVVKGVATAYYLSTNKDAIVNSLKYNLQQSVQNDRAFLGGQFSQGGFNGWFAASQNAANNPFGAQLTAEAALNKQIDAAVQNRLTELNWGKGFLSWRKCDAGSANTGGPTALTSAENCDNPQIQTPGSVIESQLENSLGTGIRQLELADSFNEIVGALMGQLVNQVLGGSGLAGTGQPSSGSTNPYLNQATNDTSATVPLQQGFVATLDGFIAQMTTFQRNWTIIKNAAQEAKDALIACNTDASTTLLTSEVQPTIDEANTKLETIAASLTSANNIRTQASTISGTDTSSQLLTLSNQYSVLVATFSPDEFLQATANATDSTDPLSTYTRMKQIASDANSRGCLIVH